MPRRFRTSLSYTHRLAFLCSIVEDVPATRNELGTEGSKLLARGNELADRRTPAWRATGRGAQRGYDALRFPTRL